MERLSGSVSTVAQLCKPINVRTPEDGHDTFSETSVRNSATRYKVSEDFFNIYPQNYNSQTNKQTNSVALSPRANCKINGIIEELSVLGCYAVWLL
jgi:hypothetical protein